MLTLVVLCALSAKPSQAPKPPQAPPMVVVVEKAPSCKKPDCDCGCNDGSACKCILKKAKSCHCSPLCTCGCNDGQSCVCSTLSVPSATTPVTSPQRTVSGPSAFYGDAILYTTLPPAIQYSQPLPYYQPPAMNYAPVYRPATNYAPAMSFGGGFSSGGC